MFLRTLFLSTIILFTHFATADEAADKAEFKKLYAEFNELYAKSDALDPIIAVAEKLYKLAPKVYGENSKNVAATTYNLASLYFDKGQENQFIHLNNDSVALFKKYFKQLEVLEQKQDRNYIDQYLKYIQALYSDSEGKRFTKHTEKVLALAKSNQYTPLEMAELEFTVGYFHFKNDDSTVAEDNFERSKEIYEREYGTDHFKVGEALFWIGKMKMARNSIRPAERAFLEALYVFKKNNHQTSDLNLSTHAFLMQLYGEMGKTDAEIEHCQAIAELTPNRNNQNIIPLYQKKPVFPKLKYNQRKKIINNKVEVLLEFDVDKNCTTKNIKIISSENEMFNDGAIRSILDLRFAPNLTNGQITEAKNVRYKYVFLYPQ